MDESDFSEGNEEGEEAQEEVLDPDNPEHAFAILERNFNRTVAEIEQNPEAAQYSEDFHHLFENFFSSYQKCQELETKQSELLKDIEQKNEVIETANKLADLDKGTIGDLKAQIDHAWRLADAAHAREQAAQEAIDNLRKQIDSLNAEIEFRNKMGEDTSEEMGQLSKHKEGLERENQKLIGEVTHLTHKLNNALEYQNELERKTSLGDMKINELAGQLEDQVNETEKFKRIRDKLENDIVELNFKIEDKDVQANSLNQVIQTHLKSIGKLEEKIKEEKVSKEKIHKEYEVVQVKFTKLLDDFNAKQHHLDTVQKELGQKITDIKVHEDDLSHLRADFAKVSKQKEIFEKRLYTMESEKVETVNDRNQLRTRLAVFEKEIDDLKKQIEAGKRVIENINREKEIIAKSIARYEAVHKEQNKLLKIQEQGKKKLEFELDNYIIENNKQIKQILTLERQKNSLAEEQINLTKKIEDYMDDIKLKKSEIYDLKKNISEADNRLRMQQNLYDQVRSERNALEKSLQEANAESGELKNKLKISNHQIEQLKEDVTTKEQLLIKEENIMRKVQKEKENLKVELNNAHDQIRNLKESIAEKDAEEKRLHKQILGNEKQIRELTKDLEQLMNERDILGSQLVRRNDEIALLHEKILILQTTLQRGESQYAQRLEDIRLLKMEIKRLRQEKNLMSKTLNNSVDLKQELFHLERDLMKWRLKCRALEEELQNPMNIHRWRKLEGSDPELLDVLQKVQLLQKRLIKQSSEAIERERHLKEAEELYNNLKNVLAKQPGPGLKEELNKTQKALKDRGDQLKCLVSELNMAELQAKEYKSDLQRVTDELNDLKRKYIADKKAQKIQKMAYESSREVNQYHNKENGAQVKYTGVRMPRSLEVCVDSYESAVAAITGGATRLELCSSLADGGLTPTPGLLLQILEYSKKIPVFCMLRCRPGNFVYTTEEMEIMKKDATILQKYGAHGFVFGALNTNDEVDMKQCREIIMACFPNPVTFHRAFDICKRPTIEIEVIIDLGFTRVLTSGQQSNAQLGVKLIKSLMEQVGDRIGIMPGGGINKQNLGFIIEHTDAKEYHGSFKKVKEASEENKERKSEADVGNERPIYVTDEDYVAEVVHILKTA